jgi:hypothetical protein
MNVSELFAICVCVVPVVAMVVLCSIQLWLSYRMSQRIASHAWRMMQANLALSQQPFAANLALKQEDTAKAEAEAAITQNQNGRPMSDAMRARNFINGE